MPLVCVTCGAFALKGVESNQEILQCAECRTEIGANIWPVFIVTGTSGAGKSTLVPELRSRLTNALVVDADLLWNRCAKGHYVNNWLRIAYSTAQTGKFTVICGTLLPGDIAVCEDRHLVGTVYFLNLHCNDEDRERRLRARPAQRGVNDRLLEDYKTFASWLLSAADNEKEFNPKMPIFNSSDDSLAEVADQISVWIGQRAPQEPALNRPTKAPGA